MAFLILLFLALTTLQLPWTEPPFGWGLRGGLLATAAAVALPTLAAVWLARRTRRRLLTDSFRREATLRAYGRGRVLHLLALMGCYVLALAGLGWGWAVRTVCDVARPDELPFGAELLLIAPFLAGLVLSWAAFYTAERTAAETSLFGPARPFGGRAGYVTFLARQHLAVVGVPLALMVVSQGLMRIQPALFDGARVILVPLGLVGAALVLAPWPLRLILGARPLPPGPLRSRLEATARRLYFRYTDILLWDTRGGVANAMVTGPLPWLRYVFLSDRLVDELTPDEVEAVFGHEVGHVRHGHLLYYALFLSLSLTALGMVWMLGMGLFANGYGQPILPANAADAADGEAWEAVPQVLLAGTYVFVVFGFLSRRCERQADVYGCRAVSCPAAACDGHAAGAPLAPAGRGLCPTGIRTFIGALDKVAVANGVCRRRPGWLQAWLHGTIARRVEFLERVIADRRAEWRFQRRLGLLKWGLLIGLGAVVLALAAV
jgi:Zn-dependent protease with chaperone function